MRAMDGDAAPLDYGPESMGFRLVAVLLWLVALALTACADGAAGAASLGLADEVGDLSPGKSADFVLVRPRAGSTLAAVLERADSMEERLGAVFTLAREESIAEVRVEGKVVWPR
jgi:cytosine/adenosine deaminase-related metal-dependent hydrolase